MANFICCYSGLEVKTNHFPMYLSSREPHLCSHPIFHASQKSLLSYARKWSARELTPTDSYLLFIALLRSTELVYFRAPAKYIPRELIESEYGSYSSLGTDSIVATNMEALMVAICRINSLSSTRVKFPEVIISAETNILWNVKHWIDSWVEVWKDYHEGVSRQEHIARISEREIALHRMIKSPHRKIESYSKDLAEWADEAGSFPTFLITTPDDRKIPYNEYYIELIQLCAAREFSKVNRRDLEELIETIHERIEAGSIQFHLLMEILKGAKGYLMALMVEDSKKSVVYKLRPQDTWKFADDSDELSEHETKLIEETSEEAPVASNFAKKIDYIKAKIKFEAAQAARKKLSSGHSVDNSAFGF